jgi:uncharacterized protein (TIGR02145 family)
MIKRKSKMQYNNLLALKMKELLKIVLLNILFLFLLAAGGTLKAQEDVKIGKQVWMQENLSVRVFRNGDLIPVVDDNKAWQNAKITKTPAMCIYETNGELGNKYGMLYNWYAVIDNRGLAPEGWHIPTDSEWQTMIDFLGTEDLAGEKLKSTSGWNDFPDKKNNGTNSSGFGALPGGMRNWAGRYLHIGNTGAWWTVSEKDETSAWIRSLSNDTGKLVSHQAFPKATGLSVRCVKD